MKRTTQEIISHVSPAKSAKRYDNRWKQFQDYANISDCTIPTEEQILQFFDHLKNDKEYFSSTIWSIYSLINSKTQLVYGMKLQKFPRVTMLPKSFEAGYQRKTAGCFSKEQLIHFLIIISA